MNARIDIRTPSGKSLDGFPKDLDRTSATMLSGHKFAFTTAGQETEIVNLHKGDVITIEIL